MSSRWNASARRPSARPALRAVAASRSRMRSSRPVQCPVWLSCARSAAILRGNVRERLVEPARVPVGHDAVDDADSRAGPGGDRSGTAEVQVIGVRRNGEDPAEIRVVQHNGDPTEPGSRRSPPGSPSRRCGCRRSSPFYPRIQRRNVPVTTENLVVRAFNVLEPSSTGAARGRSRHDRCRASYAADRTAAGQGPEDRGPGSRLQRRDGCGVDRPGLQPGRHARFGGGRGRARVPHRGGPGLRADAAHRRSATAS